MARARNIKPSFFKNDELAELSFDARLCFVGLWTLADCNGRLELRPKRIKAELFPYDNVDVEKIVINLDKYRFIRIYSVQGKQYIEIANFTKHQNPHKNERDKGSEIPAPSESTPTAQESQGAEEKPEKIGTAPESNGSDRADSPFLIPDSPFLNEESPSPSGDEQPAEKKPACRFEEFWKIWPVKENKKKAKQIWKRKKLNDKADLLINDVINRNANCQKWADGYIPHATTYFNGERWNDELKQPTSQNQKQHANGNGGGSALDKVLAGINATTQGHHEQTLGDDDPAIRPPMGEQLRGGSRSDGSMGSVLEGDFTRHD